MPLTALGAQGQVIDSTEKDDEVWVLIHRVKPPAVLTCRECGTEMSAKVSKLGTRFFAHHPSDVECSSQGETEAHLNLKKFIARTLRELNVEPIVEAQPGPDDVGLWRADVLVHAPDGRRIAFEAQLSPMSMEEGKYRTDRYARDGIETVWVTTKNIHWLNALPGVRIVMEGENGVVDHGVACLTVFGQDYEAVEKVYGSVREKSLARFFEPLFRPAFKGYEGARLARWEQVEAPIDFQSLLQGLLVGTITSITVPLLAERGRSGKVHPKEALFLVSKRSKTEAERVQQERFAEQERQRVIREEREAEFKQRIGNALSRHELEEEEDFQWRQREAPPQPNRSTFDERSGRPARIVPQEERTLAVTEAQLRVLEKALMKIRSALGQGIPLWIGPPSREWDGKFPVRHPGFKTRETEGFGLSIWSGALSSRLTFEAIICPLPGEISLGLGGYWRSQGTMIYVETQPEAQAVAKSLDWLLDSLVITGL